MASHFEDVKKFNGKFGMMINDEPVHLTHRKLNERFQFLREELEEFRIACCDQDIAEQADALVDLVYVAIGTAVMMGLPWEALWNDVHRANMSKVLGPTKRGHRIDCIKPEGWEGPKGFNILLDYRYNPTHRINIKEHKDDD